MKIEPEKLIEKKTIYRGNIIDVSLDKVILDNGSEAIRETVYHPGAVAVVALTNSKDILLVEQYRHPSRENLLELPAGKLERGESPVECAKRELSEETGFEAQNWLKMNEFYTAPGFASEKMYMYYADSLTKVKTDLDEDENIALRITPYKDALSMILSGKIKDGKTIAGLLFFESFIKSKD